MGQQIEKLQSEIDDKMIKKFGMHVDFDDMEESILKKVLLDQSKNSNENRKNEMEIKTLKVWILILR